MVGLSIIPHMLGFGQITYSLGLSRWRSQIPSVSLRMKKTEIFVEQILESGTLVLRATQRVSVTQRELFRGSRRPHWPRLQVKAGSFRSQPPHLGDQAATACFEYLKAPTA